MIRRGGPAPIIAIAALLALAGCRLAGSQPPKSIDCGSVPRAACSEQADRLAATAGAPVSSVALECRVASCTRAGGVGVADITLTNGRSLTMMWSYAGDPNPPPVPICLGIAPDLCREQVTSVVDDVTPAHHIVSVTATCKQRCDRSGGEVDIVFRSADGSTDQIGSAWGSAP